MIPDYEKEEKLRQNMNDLCDELDSLLKNPIKAVANKGRISELNKKIQNIALKAFKLMDKSDSKVFQVTDMYNRIVDENETLWDRNRELSGNNNDYRKENQQLKETVSDFKKIISVLEKLDKPAVDTARAIIEQDRLQHSTEKNIPKKRRNYELE